MGWISLGGSAEYKNTNADSNSNTYGTRTPVVSDQYTGAFNQLKAGVYDGSGGTQIGANNPENTAIDYWKNILAGGGPVPGAVAATNRQLGASSGQLDGVNTGYGAIAGQAAPQSAGAPMIDPRTGASMADPYKALYSQELIDPSLKAYDYGTDRAMSALDARTAGAGGFANSRSGFNYGDLAAENALGRGQLESQLKTTGLTNALGFGQQDANRTLTADTSNAANTLNNNQFNVTADQTNTNQKLQALGGQSASILAKAGLAQQYLANIVTQNGIDTNAAESLFASGAITQEQLNTINQAAAAYNGYTYTENNDKHSNENVIDVKAEAKI